MRAIIILVAATLAMLASPASADVSDACVVPYSMTQFDAPLPHTAARLAANQPLTIVAIGSSSTAGAGASTPSNSYPSRLVVALKTRFPHAAIKVLNRGVNGEIEKQMEARFGRDVLLEHPDLVIWQVGTNSVIRDNDIGQYRSALDAGIAQLKAAGADVVIMDMQFAPKVLVHPGYQAMLRDIATAARDESVPVFHRFAIMRHWITSGQLSFAAILSPDQLHLNDLSYGCIADLLADAIVDAVHAPVLSNAVATDAANGASNLTGKQHLIGTGPVKTAVDAAAAKKKAAPP
jgi:lysophospholipase L1-like esterase